MSRSPIDHDIYDCYDSDAEYDRIQEEYYDQVQEEFYDHYDYYDDDDGGVDSIYEYDDHPELNYVNIMNDDDDMMTIVDDYDNNDDYEYDDVTVCYDNHNKHVSTRSILDGARREIEEARRDLVRARHEIWRARRELEERHRYQTVQPLAASILQLID